MFDKLKDLAMSKLAEKMEQNSLGENETKEAAQEGGNAFLDLIKSKVAEGKFPRIQEMLEGKGKLQENEIFQDLKGKMQDILKNKGMEQGEAEKESEGIIPGLIDNLKDRFLSKEDADKDFDLSKIEGIVGGLGGDKGKDVMDKVKGFFGK